MTPVRGGGDASVHNEPFCYAVALIVMYANEPAEPPPDPLHTHRHTQLESSQTVTLPSTRQGFSRATAPFLSLKQVILLFPAAVCGVSHLSSNRLTQFPPIIIFDH